MDETRWRYCPHVVLRAPGFSIDDVLGLADLETWSCLESGDPRQTIAASLSAQARPLRLKLREIIARSAFREAVLWQNPPAARQIDEELECSLDLQNAPSRSLRRLLTLYIQRYTTKNDTIGFFGPVGWATVAPAPETLLVAAPGPSLLRRRRTLFEHWSIITLAEALAGDPELRMLLPPRLTATVRLDGDTLHYGADKRAALPANVAALLRLCDGKRAAVHIAEALAADGETDPEWVELTLEELVERGLLAWTPAVPFHPDLAPEQALRRSLAAVPSSSVRERALARVDELEESRAAVARAAGDYAAVDAALTTAAARFESLTGEVASRRSGEMYAAREIVFESDLRDYDLVLGQELLRRLDAPLSLLLVAARWCVHRVATRYRGIFAEAHGALRGELGTPEVPLASLLHRTRGAFRGEGGATPAPIAETVRELVQRWVEILAVSPDEGARVTRRSSELRALVEERFAAPDAGMPHGQVHSPDVMVIARDAAALRAGDYQLVLGELHIATDTVSKPTFLNVHPEPLAVRSWIEAMYDRPLIEWVVPTALQSHVVQVTHDPQGISIEMDDAVAWRDPARVFRLADLVAVERDGAIRVRSPDGRLDVEIVDFASFEISAHIGSAFRVWPSTSGPRISVDDLVITRQQWQFSVEEMRGVLTDDPVDRWIELHRIARAQGIPRWFFLRTPEETKPVFVDLANPALVEIAARLVRRASRVAITEMLPGPDELWVRDAAGARYTSELRLLAVDPHRYRWR